MTDAKRIFRHCVFAITVNDEHFLIDMTGNRRYLILHCNSPKFSYVKGLTDEYISQVWAEVYQRYCEFRESNSDLSEKAFVDILEKKLQLSDDAQIQGEKIADTYLRDDGLTGEIEAFINTKIPHSVIWDLLSKEERRKFFANGGNLPIFGGKDELIIRRKTRGGRNKNVDADIKKIDELLSPQNDQKLYRKIADNQIVIYGSEYRQHICAAEIFNECFDNDKRKSMTRIHEILATLSQWQPGKMLSGYNSCYGMQRKVFYRTVQPEEPNDDDDNTHDKPADNREENSAPVINGQNQKSCNEPRQSSNDDFIGELVNPNDLPPFSD